MSNLTYFNLRTNQLTGSVPVAVAEVGANTPTCNFMENVLCIPDTAAYLAIGVDPICGLPLSSCPDSDGDGYEDWLEESIGTNPLDHNSWPWVICLDSCPFSDTICDECASDFAAGLPLVSPTAEINYFGVVQGATQDNDLTISGNMLVGIESGVVVLQP